MTEYAFIPPAVGQPQSAFVGAETPSLAIDRGEPDEIVSMAVVAARLIKFLCPPSLASQ